MGGWLDTSEDGVVRRDMEECVTAEDEEVDDARCVLLLGLLQLELASSWFGVESSEAAC